MQSIRLVTDRRRAPRMLDAYCDRLYQVYERDRAEAALRLARDEAEIRAREAQEAMMEARAADKAKSEFLAAMSHELRTPLNAIIGFSDLLGRELGENGDAKLEEYASDIQGSGEHLLAIINDILDVAKIEVGKFELIESDFYVSDVTSGAVRLVEGRAREASIEILQEIPAGLPRVYGDERRLKQAVLNLLSNAVKFTPPNGSIRVTARVTEDHEIEIKVSDNGIGIDPSRIDEIQQPFVQADGELSRSYEGTGLGLYITRAIIGAHGGRLVIESALGEGTRAALLIPEARLRGKVSPTEEHASQVAKPKKAADKEKATKKSPAKSKAAKKKSTAKKPAAKKSRAKKSSTTKKTATGKGSPRKAKKSAKTTATKPRAKKSPAKRASTANKAKSKRK